MVQLYGGNHAMVVGIQISRQELLEAPDTLRLLWLTSRDPDRSPGPVATANTPLASRLRRLCSPTSSNVKKSIRLTFSISVATLLSCVYEYESKVDCVLCWFCAFSIFHNRRRTRVSATARTRRAAASVVLLTHRYCMLTMRPSFAIICVFSNQGRNSVGWRGFSPTFFLLKPCLLPSKVTLTTYRHVAQKLTNFTY